MKKIISNIFAGVVAIGVSTLLWSCVAENPFESDGEGIVRLYTEVNSITTRADEPTSDPLRANCVVYISNEKGLIYKEKGLDNVKESFSLKAGEYVAEAWTGDSVSASFDKKFYRGYQPFTVTKGGTTNVVINCGIANVVASIDATTIDPNLMKDDYNIIIKNSKGELLFDKNNSSYAKGYFMMPSDDSKLEYEITGTNIDGQSFEKKGEIKDVKKAHHYILNFEYNPDGEQGTTQVGAVFIKINVKEEEITDTKNEVFTTGPTITSFRYNLEKQLNFIDDEDIPEKLDLQICGFKGLKSIKLKSESASDLGWPTGAVDILENNDNTNQILASGVDCNVGALNPQTNVQTATVSFHKSLLERLSKVVPEGEKAQEHIITITVEDMDDHGASEAYLRIVRNAGAIKIEDPIIVEKINPGKDFMSVTPHSITVAYSLDSSYEGDDVPGIEYSKDDEDNWTFVAVSDTSVEKSTIKISGLDPATTYKYRAACGEFRGDEILKVTTESKFIIPNASFEEWGTYKAKTMLGTKTVTFPGSGTFGLNERQYEDHFWDSGNEGAATANLTLTDKYSDIKHSGQYSARLASNSAMGVIAAGNIFIGQYVKTDGTNGVLSVGRTYNGSHPSKLKVYVNYRPGSGVSIKSENKGYLPDDFVSGSKDQGQIYIALTTEEVELRTNPSNRKLFNSDDNCVLAYGEITWKDNFGPDGSLQEIEIPFTYNARANNNKPTHLVIVCSASKYGDYFSGSASSVMYVDDFELIYE